MSLVFFPESNSLIYFSFTETNGAEILAQNVKTNKLLWLKKRNQRPLNYIGSHIVVISGTAGACLEFHTPGPGPDQDLLDQIKTRQRPAVPGPDPNLLDKTRPRPAGPKPMEKLVKKDEVSPRLDRVQTWFSVVNMFAVSVVSGLRSSAGPGVVLDSETGLTLSLLFLK